MRADVVSLGFAITLLSASLAHGQVSINVSKVTCDQFANGKVGLPRTTAIWLNGYYHGKTGSTTIDTQQSEDMFGKLINFCQTGENGKVPVMQATRAPTEVQVTRISGDVNAMRRAESPLIRQAAVRDRTR